jgi:membrane dipeptidase
LLDLAHMNPAAAAEVLDWFEDDASRSSSLIPVYSHGGLRHDGFVSPRALTLENLERLRRLGGVVGFSVGPPFYETAAQIREGIEAAAALPFEGRPGFEGIAIGTDFLGVDQTLPGLSNVEGVVAWLRDSFAPESADALTSGNARRLIERAVGVGPC